MSTKIRGWLVGARDGKKLGLSSYVFYPNSSKLGRFQAFANLSKFKSDSIIFFKVFYLPGSMIERCGEQFCAQHSTPKSVHLQDVSNFICSSELIFLHSVKNQDHFLSPLNQGVHDINLKMCHSKKELGFYCRRVKKINEINSFLTLFLKLSPLFICPPHRQD